MTPTRRPWSGPAHGRPGPPPVTAGALLRRADWRFLLPTPPEGGFPHLVLLGGPPGLAARLVALGVAARVSGSLPRAQVVDALIVLADAPTPLRAATCCLRPGGVLYAEIARWRQGSWGASPQRLARALAQKGLTVTGCYAVRPGFEACELYLPLDVPTALAWYVSTHYPAASPLQRLAEEALRSGTGLRGDRFAALVPGYAVTAVVGATGAPPSVLGHPELLEALRQPGLRPLVIVAGQDGGNRATLLPFAPGASAPAAVLKVTKLPTFNGRTEHEQQVLTTLRATLPADLRAALPQPMGTLAVGRCVATIESYQPGRSLLRTSGRWCAAPAGAQADLKRAAQWLSDFHLQAGLSQGLWGDTTAERWLVRPLAAFEQRFGLSGTEARGFGAARTWAQRLVGLPFPTVWQHRDFNVWNLFREGAALAVVDWEGARRGPALCDLLHFVTHWHDTVRHLRAHPARLAGVRRLFLEPHQGDTVVASARAALAMYRQRLGLDVRFQPLLLLYLWVELALRRAAQQEEMGTLGPDVRQGNPFLDYVALLAAGAEQGWGGDLDG